MAKAHRPPPTVTLAASPVVAMEHQAILALMAARLFTAAATALLRATLLPAARPTEAF